MQIPSNITTTSALIFPAIIFFFILIKKWKKKTCLKLPPGPKTLPIIGNLHLITSPPFRCFRELSKQYGPIMHLMLGQTPAVVVSSPEIAKQMLKDHDPTFANRPPGVALEIVWYNYLDVAFAPYGDYWKQMRKICINELLSPKMVRSFGSIRSDEAARLVAALHRLSGETVNLTEMILSYSSSITCRAAIGNVCEDSETLIELMRETVKMVGGFEVADLFPSSRVARALSWPARRRLKMMRRKLDAILDRIIDERKSGNGEPAESEDLLDVFIRIMETERLQFPIDNDNIKAVLYDMFTAGTDTTSTIIDWLMVELIRNPKVMGKAVAEVRHVLRKNNSTSGTTSCTLLKDKIQKLRYLKLVIKEGLRLHPPTSMLPRASREERVINGYAIPADVNVMINVWAIQRDPKLWDDPEKFEPERFEFINHGVDFGGGDFRFLPFGTGRRMCPGITFGLASVEMALAHLLYNFDWKLPEGVKLQDMDMIENHGLTASRKDKLFLVATPYIYMS